MPYQNIYIQRKESIAHIWDDKRGYFSFQFKDYCFRKKSGGKYKSIYGDQLEKVYEFDKRDPDTFEADVSPDTKILLDLYQDTDEVSTGHRIAIIDIEVSTAGGFPVVNEGNKPITAISIYDQTESICYALIVDTENKIQPIEREEIGWINPKLNDKIKIIITPYQDEESLIQAFLNKWEEIQPTIVSGWNSTEFDLPYCYNRIKRVFGHKDAKRLSPIGECYMNTWNNRMVIAGVSCMDYLKLYKKFRGKTQSSYALDYVGQIEVGMSKVKYRGDLNTLYREDISKYIEYNINDVRLVAAIDDKFKFIDLARGICHAGHVPYECFDTPTKYLEGAILLYLRRNGMVAPNKPIYGNDDEGEYGDGNDEEDESEEKFSGAYVKVPVPGRYEWVYDLDLTSMYPNIIISLNISPEAKVGKVNKIEIYDEFISERRNDLIKENNGKKKPIKDIELLEEWINTEIKKFDANFHVKNKIKNYYLGHVVYTPDEFKSFLKQTGHSLSSNGIIYDVSKVGVIPSKGTSYPIKLS